MQRNLSESGGLSLSANPLVVWWNLPLLLLAATTGLLVMAAGQAAPMAVLGAAIALAGVLGGGWWTARAVEPQWLAWATSLCETERANLREQTRQQQAPVEALCGRVSPLWRQHVETGRGQLDQALSVLSAQFGELVLHFDQAEAAAASETGLKSGGEGLLASTLRVAREELLALKTELHQALKAKETMLSQMTTLEQTTKILKERAGEVAQIAAQTNLVALNAAIEAARAGEAGRGFSVVADEVRKLSTKSGQTGEHIRDVVDRLVGDTQRVLNVAGDSTAQDEAVMARADSTITTVLERFGQTSGRLGAAHGILERATDQAKNTINRIIVDLQAQDRACQILGHVCQDLEKFEQHLTTRRTAQSQGLAPPVMDVDAWLAEMNKTYTTLEQRATHQGQGAVAKRATASDVTFF
ncbi:MAG: methyl-accepting chemotaxis protein [Pseudomonadota bacterium]